jgi:hypothetical protein
VRDAAYEPLRICQNANKFKKTKNEKGEDAWTPVPPSENLPGQQYVNTSMEKLDGRIFLPDLQFVTTDVNLGTLCISDGEIEAFGVKR